MKKSSCGTKMSSAKKVTAKGPAVMSGKKMYNSKTTKK